jgi:hypothetical protein
VDLKHGAFLFPINRCIVELQYSINIPWSIENNKANCQFDCHYQGISFSGWSEMSEKYLEQNKMLN